VLTPPDLSAGAIISCVRDSYGLPIRQATFLPIGADSAAAVYRLDATDGTAYFLKLRRGTFYGTAVAVAAFLHEHGAPAVMAPLATIDGARWTSGHGFAWILYPFFTGTNGFAAPLSNAQWIALGKSLRAVHALALPAALAARIPREEYSPHWRDDVVAFDQQVEADRFADPIAARLAAFWRTKRQEIHAMVERAGELGETLRTRALPFALCHTDLHAGNVLLGADDALAIVDWDDPLLAPKERDLMFIGGGVGAIWDSAREEALFYQGYGPVEIDPVALAYYRNERIVADLAAYGAQILGAQGSMEDRDHGLRKVIGAFQPNRVVEIAHRTYQRLP
jgi:spectinomycin phosphotransferase